MKIVIAGGGTGGHIFPGIAIAEEIKRRDNSAEVIFIGTAHGIEASIIPAEGYPIRFLRAEGIVGRSLMKKCKAGIKTLFALYDAYRILKELKPDGIIGVGGYASFSPALAGYLMSIPVAIAEQNSVPGLANKMLSRVADVVCATYHESVSFFPRDKTYITGNPIRQGILNAGKETAYEVFGLQKDRFTVFVFGGSSGARKINSALCEAFSYLNDIRDDIQFLHQTGRNDYETVRETYRKWGFKGTVAAFIHKMPEAYAAADIVLSRAGATTLAELTAVGKPAILIPYPYAAGHHQEVNANRLLEMGAARVILDSDLSGEVLGKNIKELYEDTSTLAGMQRSSKSLGKPDAAQKVVDVVMSMIKQSAVFSHKSNYATDENRRRKGDKTRENV